MKRFYLLTLATTLTFTGCNKDDGVNPPPQNLAVEQTHYTLSAVEERTATVSFTAPADWSLSVVYDETEANADWLSVAPTGGAAGLQTVQLSVRLNFGETTRTAYVDIVSGELRVRLTVTQDISDDTDFTTLFDKAFAQELQKQKIIFDAGKITLQDMENITAVTELDVSGSYSNPGSLTSIQGIEYFESLTKLDCASNQLTSLNVSGCTALTELWCNGNQLTSLNVSGCTALTELWCGSNQLTTLNVRKNTKLWLLYCSGNQLTALDVSGCTKLGLLDCASNQLTSLDISGCTALEQVACDSNQLTGLDVSSCTALTLLYCNNNQLTALNVNNNTELWSLMCEDNPGDGISTFPITAWFDNATVPETLHINKMNWEYDSKTITIDFLEAE